SWAVFEMRAAVAPGQARELRNRPKSLNYPGTATVRGEQAAKDHAWEMGRGDGRIGPFDLSGEGVAGALGQFWIDVAQASPFVVEELDGAVDDVAQEQPARGARREDDDRTAGGM